MTLENRNRKRNLSDTTRAGSNGSYYCDPDELARLMRKVQENPDRHFAEFYQAVWSDVYRLTYGILGNVSDAEVAAQSALIRVYHSCDKLADPQKTKKWLYRVASNAALSYRRDEGRHTAPARRDDIDIGDFDPVFGGGAISAGDGAPGLEAFLRGSADTNGATYAAAHYLPEELAISKEVSRGVFEHILQLPPRQSEAIMLYTYAELSVREVAAEMGISEKAVQSLLSRAREHLNASIRNGEKREESTSEV